MQTELPGWAETLVVFDTETTGVSPTNSRIVSAAIAILNASGEAEERFDWLIDPGIEIPDSAALVHGITTEMVKANGMKPEVAISQIVEKISELLENGYPLVVYNAPYDLTLLRAESKRHSVAFPDEIRHVLDPLIIDKQIDRYRRGKRTLTAACGHYGVELLEAHDAGADAIAAGQLLQKIARKHHMSLPKLLSEMHEQQIAWAAAQAASFQEFMRKSKDPSFIADGSWPIRIS